MDGLFARSLDKSEKLVVIYMDSRGEVSQRSIRVMDIRAEDIFDDSEDMANLEDFLSDDDPFTYEDDDDSQLTSKY